MPVMQIQNYINKVGIKRQGFDVYVIVEGQGTPQGI
jgi:hypothetical protein